MFFNKDDVTVLMQLHERFAKQGMTLVIQTKAVKNINFRVKLGYLYVSTPKSISRLVVAQAIAKRYDWAVSAHQRLLARQQTVKPTLWGEPLVIDEWLNQARLSQQERLSFGRLNQEEQVEWIYRAEIQQVLPSISQRWQMVVGKSASAFVIKNMRSRWGSCQVVTAKIALSSRLAAYPRQCLEYVVVHELCHLHHANHGSLFWESVKQAMPDYQHWHSLLRGQAL